MISAFMLSIALLGADDPPAVTTASAIEAYREAVARTGKNSDAQVRLALWCEAHGLTAERLKHLSLAVLYEPKNSLARGLMGLVAYQGKWQRPEQVSQDVQDDPQRNARIKEYLERRFKAPDRAEDQWKLALWCEQNGLKEQANAHLHQVIQLDPKRDSAWKRLGYKRVGGRWIKPDAAADAKVQARKQQSADHRWKPVLERLRNGLRSKDPSRRAEAEKALSQITDRWAVPTVWATFGRGDESLQKVAVRVLGQIDDASASRSLAMLAVFSGSAGVRRQAIETLRRRDAREFAGLLIAMIQPTIKYKVKRVGGPGKPGELFIYGRGSTPNLKRVYAPPAGPSIAQQPGDQIQLDSNGLPVIYRTQSVSTFEVNYGFLRSFYMSSVGPPPTAEQQSQIMGVLTHSGLGAQGQQVGQILINAAENQYRFASSALSPNPLMQLAALSQGGMPLNSGSEMFYTMANRVAIPVGQMEVEVQKSAATAEQQLENDVASIKQFNASLDQVNDRVVPVLNEISAQNLGPDSVAWLKWFNNLVGFNTLQASEPPTVTENVPLTYEPQPIPVETFAVPIHVERRSCFGAGTIVATLTGSKPIETLKLGDLVLSQSIKTGALAYKPILVVHHNPPSKTFEIKLGNETIVSSYFHRFWKAGAGWVMARDLKVGDPIRTLNGTVKVTAIEDGKVVPVFNLDVADDSDFFVGDVGALAHDNTVPDLRETPFDAVTMAGHSDNSSRDQASSEGKP